MGLAGADGIDSILEELGDMLAEKEEEYGSSFDEAPRLLAMLTNRPQDSETLAVARVLDKIARICSESASPETLRDAWMDIAGYAVLSVRRASLAGIPQFDYDSMEEKFPGLVSMWKEELRDFVEAEAVFSKLVDRSFDSTGPAGKGGNTL